VVEVKKVYAGPDLAAAVMEGDEVNLVARAIIYALPYAGWTSAERTQLAELYRELDAPAP
jgi:hypothetical protein